MKKAGIITFQESNNFGALLQAYALKIIVEKFGYECEIINYHSKFKESQYNFTWSKNRKFLVNVNLWLSQLLSNDLYDEFRRKYLKIGDLLTKDELIVYIEKFDKVICGSDQVWNGKNTGYDDIYFLSFVKDINKKIAYAPSFGFNKFSENVNFYKDNITNFKYLSIREKTAAEMIKSIINKDAEIVLDPSLLIKKEEWNKFVKNTNKKEYIFLYYIGYNSKMIKFVKKLSKLTGLEIIQPLKTFRDYRNGFRVKKIGPIEFVDYIANAKYVVTNSFHGIAFSINLNKSFFAFTNTNSMSKSNNRITDFLGALELLDRLDPSINDYDNQIEYLRVNEKLDQLRNSSLEFLRKGLEYDG